jgi:hypothetical protein
VLEGEGERGYESGGGMLWCFGLSRSIIGNEQWATDKQTNKQINKQVTINNQQETISNWHQTISIFKINKRR